MKEVKNISSQLW